MAVKLTIYDKAFLRQSKKRQERFLRAAAMELHRLSREAANTPNTGEVIKFKTKRLGEKVRNKTQRTVYRDPAPPNVDHAPHKRTGFGREQIVQGFSAMLMVSRVGYTRPGRYMTFHEVGIRYAKRGFQQRPTIVPTLRTHQGQIRRVAIHATRGIG